MISGYHLQPATKQKQVRVCTDERHLALFGDQHHNLGCLIFFLGEPACSLGSVEG